MNTITMFIDAPTLKEKKHGITRVDVNGDQFARDINAAVFEREQEGFELMSTTPVHSSKQSIGANSYGLTIGVLLTFKKINT